jgi:pimeloyl-ACP methyl ester carboxylesterase
MPKVRVSGIDMFYNVVGSGSPLLLIPGFACDHMTWLSMVPALSARFRVVMLDNRGVGQSSGADSVIGIRQMADDAAALMDAIGLSKVHVAGHSMGGMIAQALALACPRRIQSLTLLSSSAKLDERGKAIIESWGDLPKQVGVATASQLILPWIYTSAFYARPGAIDGLIELILANPYAPSTEVVYRQSRAISQWDNSDRLGRLDCPTLILVGEEDILLPVSYSERLAQGIGGAELRVLPQTGHGLLLESPEAVASAMLDFLARHDRLGSIPV